MGRIVKAYGPSEAPVLWIGEAPGREEERAGKPFVGPSGEEARRALRMAKIHDVGEVLWANAVSVNPGTFPSGKLGSRLLKEHALQLDETLEHSDARVIILCGGQALKRLTGFTSITDWTGSVIRPDWLRKMLGPSELIDLGNGYEHKLVLPKNVEAIIPVLHPAGYMRTKGKDNLPIFYRGVDKAGRVLRGELETYPFEPVLEPTIEKLRSSLDAAIEKNGGHVEMAFDTEFNPDTKELYQVGLTFDGLHIFGFSWLPRYFGFVRDVMRDPRVTKIAHNIRADQEILEANKIMIEGPTYCTMIGTYVLHPEFMVGLSPSSRYYLDAVINTKWMDKDDPIYNCFDVQFCYLLKQKQSEELAHRLRTTGTDQSGVMERRQRLIQPAFRMEQVGMLIDQQKRLELIAANEAKVAEHQEAVETAILPLWAKRTYRVEAELEEANDKYRRMRQKYVERCSKHPAYYPGRKPPKGCPACNDLYNGDEGVEWRAEYEYRKKKRDKLKAEAKKLEKGFNFNSGNDLAWLLYSPDGLNLPIRRNKNKKPTTNADAIERISQSAAARKREGFGVVLKIKEMQQATKAKSTFLDIPIDEHNRVHPPYKVHGTRTGRPASGMDVSGESDKVSKKYAYNILNIPKEWRSIYVAPPGQCIVAADWKNQEGRLMAYFSQDQAYKRAFRDEDAGGHDVHSITASIIYGIDPADSRTTKTAFNGSMYDMRHCAKVANHACSYSPTPEKTLMKNFQMEKSEAIRIVDALDEARPGIRSYKNRLIEEVLGRWEPSLYNGSWYAVCREPGSLWDATPFGWLLYFYGGATVYKNVRTDKREALPDQSGEVCAMRQQNSGAEMWAECVNMLHYDHNIIAMTGAYDSIYLRVNDTPKDRQDAADLLTKVMTRPWPELGNTSFPIDIEWGYNLKELKAL